MRMIRSLRALLLGLLPIISISATSSAQTAYPTSTIRMVVPFPAGGPTDTYARLVANKLQEAWGQPVYIDNRPGATGMIGATIVQRAKADGYTLLFTSNSAFVVGALTHSPPPYDPINDFTPISMLIRYPMYLLTNPEVPAKTIGEFIALAKSKPGQFNYSSVGAGSGTHLACELFNMLAGTQMVHIPYQGAAPAQMAVMSNQVQLICDSVGFSQSLVNAGKLRGLALTGTKRSAAVPEIPTLDEIGLHGVDTYTWLGVFGPAGLPKAVQAKLNAELVRIMTMPDLHDRVVKEGSEVIADTPDELVSAIKAENGVWLSVIKAKGIKVE